MLLGLNVVHPNPSGGKMPVVRVTTIEGGKGDLFLIYSQFNIIQQWSP